MSVLKLRRNLYYVEPFTPTVYTIGVDVTTVNGFSSPYDAIVPGDIIELTTGTRVPLCIRNIQGTAERPIVIRNGNGQVVINTASGWYGFWLLNNQYIQFTGSAYSQEYGIKITRAQEFGILFQCKTEYIEIDHVQIDRLDGANIGIHGSTTATTEPDYDYNGDGDIDEDDGVVNRSNFTQHDISIHNCKIDGGVGTNYIDMGMYIGYSNWHDETTQPQTEGLHIYDNIVGNTLSKCIQCGSVISDMQIHDNYIYNGALTDDDVSGININPGCVGKIYNNIIEDVSGHGIMYRGCGGDIYNNLIIRPGRASSYYDAGISIQYPGGYSHTGDTRVMNNTIVSPLGNGIEASIAYGDDDRVHNNLIASPGDSYTSLTAGYTEDHNYQNTTANCKFTSSGTDDYTLASDSPAVGYGTSLASQGVTDDILGISRPQGAAYDAGCYERES